MIVNANMLWLLCHRVWSENIGIVCIFEENDDHSKIKS